MKTCIFLCLIFAVFEAFIVLTAAITIETIEQFGEGQQNCVYELNLDERKMKTLEATAVTPEDDIDYNNFLACSWQKAKILNLSNGEINYQNLKSLLGQVPEQALVDASAYTIERERKLLFEAIDYCEARGTKGESYGQTAVKLQNCIMNKLKEAVEAHNSYKF